MIVAAVSPRPGHITNDEREAVIVNCDRAVPIPTDLDSGLSGDIPGSELHSVDNRERFRQQRSLKRQGRHSLLSVQTSVLFSQLLRVTTPPDQALSHCYQSERKEQADKENAPGKEFRPTSSQRSSSVR